MARGFEVYEVTLPAVLTVKEGLNLPDIPRYEGRWPHEKSRSSGSVHLV